MLVRSPVNQRKALTSFLKASFQGILFVVSMATMDTICNGKGR